MIKKEMKEIEVYYCDNCGAKIAENPNMDEIEEYEDVNGDVIYLCESCWNELPVCSGCRRFALSKEDLFKDYNIWNGEAICQHCLKEELADFEKGISAAKAFLKRHGVK